MGFEDGGNKEVDLSRVSGPDEHGFYTYQLPDGTVVCGVSEDGDYLDPETGDVRNIPGFRKIIQGIKPNGTTNFDLLMALEKENGIQKVTIKGKKYSYSTWKDLGRKLKEDGVPPEEIWEECKKENPNLKREEFYHTATGVWGYSAFDLGPLQDLLLGPEERDRDSQPY